MTQSDPETTPSLDTVAEPTGNAGVDAAVADVLAVTDRPVGEHVAVFELAHERLRAVLTSPGDRP